MKTRLMGGIVAAMLALVGTLLLVSYVQASEARAQQGLEPVEVLIVQERVLQGSSLEEIRAATKVAPRPAASIPEGALTSLDGLEDKVAAADLLPGEPVLEARLADANSLAGPGSVAVPEGMQEISVQLDGQRVVGGRVDAGDTVGIVALFAAGAAKDSPEVESAQQIFHKVLVTSVQRATDTATTATTEEPSPETNTKLPEGEMIVTFALPDTDAVKVAFAAQFGNLWLTKEPSTATDSGPVVIKKPELYR